LGLSIARDVAQAHGGSLTLRNRSPHGLEATVRLPRVAAP
jgi:signal transduction histidine kinase